MTEVTGVEKKESTIDMALGVAEEQSITHLDLNNEGQIQIQQVDEQDLSVGESQLGLKLRRQTTSKVTFANDSNNSPSSLNKDKKPFLRKQSMQELQQLGVRKFKPINVNDVFLEPPPRDLSAFETEKKKGIDMQDIRNNRKAIGSQVDRKFQSTRHTRGTDKVYDGTYISIIPEKSQYEHALTQVDILDEIFRHTDKKVISNVTKIVKMFNKKRGQNMNQDVDSDLKTLIDNDISYPVEYQPMLSFLEIFLVSANKKAELEYFTRIQSSLAQGEKVNIHDKERFAKTIESPIKLAESHNAYPLFRRYGSKNRAKFMKEYGEKDKRFSERLQFWHEQINQDVDKQKKAINQEKKQLLQELKTRQMRIMAKYRNETATSGQQEYGMNRVGSQASFDNSVQYEQYYNSANRHNNNSAMHLLEIDNMTNQENQVLDSQGYNLTRTNNSPSTNQGRIVTTLQNSPSGSQLDKYRQNHGIMSPWSQATPGSPDSTLDKLKKVKFIPIHGSKTPKPVIPDSNVPFTKEQVGLLSNTGSKVRLDNSDAIRIVSPRIESRIIQDPSLGLFSPSTKLQSDRRQSLSTILPLVAITSPRQKPEPTTFHKNKRTPSLKDPDVQQLVTKYPPLKGQDKTLLEVTRQNIKDICKKAKKQIQFDNCQPDIEVVNLSQMVEKYRRDQNDLTVELLQEMEDTEVKNFKVLYNYQLNTRRENKETQEDVRQEYMQGKKNPTSFNEFMQRVADRQQRYGNQVQIKKAEKIKGVMKALSLARGKYRPPV